LSARAGSAVRRRRSINLRHRNFPDRPAFPTHLRRRAKSEPENAATRCDKHPWSAGGNSQQTAVTPLTSVIWIGPRATLRLDPDGLPMATSTFAARHSTHGRALRAVSHPSAMNTRASSVVAGQERRPVGTGPIFRRQVATAANRTRRT
jgi:hypothetical protein